MRPKQRFLVANLLLTPYTTALEAAQALPSPPSRLAHRKRRRARIMSSPRLLVVKCPLFHLRVGFAAQCLTALATVQLYKKTRVQYYRGNYGILQKKRHIRPPSRITQEKHCGPILKGASLEITARPRTIFLGGPKRPMHLPISRMKRFFLWSDRAIVGFVSAARRQIKC